MKSNPSTIPQDGTDFIDVPQHAIDRLARCFLPGIRTYFESEEGKREWEKHQRQQAEQTKTE